MAWWDDLWLNEAFATWIAGKIVDEWHPEWDGQVQRVQVAQPGDGRRRAGCRRAGSASPSNRSTTSHNAFDGITYKKGAAVIAMFEAYVGREALPRRACAATCASTPTATPPPQDFLKEVGAARRASRRRSPRPSPPSSTSRASRW